MAWNVAGGFGDGDWVLAGDCNHHPRWDKGNARWDFGSLVRAYADRGMVSAWHTHHDVAIGDPAEPATHWHTYNRDKPSMLDWCFIPAAWRDRLVGVWIGDYDHWGSGDIKSDHAPMVIDLAI
ncbi:MAG: hypothetical protein ACE367_19625 [Acidimicrobiales bacterium]